jgi:hypothetical protein
VLHLFLRSRASPRDPAYFAPICRSSVPGVTQFWTSSRLGSRRIYRAKIGPNFQSRCSRGANYPRPRASDPEQTVSAVAENRFTRERSLVRSQPRRGAIPSRFASPHPVRRSLTKLLQSPALFGGVFRCARLDYHRLTPHIIKRRQISFPQVGRSHNPLVAGSSPARPTSNPEPKTVSSQA